MPMMRVIALFAVAGLTGALAACKPPPTDEVMDRALPEQVPTGPSVPIDSPDSEGAIWAPSQIEDRIIYGQPGSAPMLALACEMDTGADTAKQPQLRLTRFAPADEGAGALFALVGNGHVARIPVDAVDYRGGFVWEGVVAAAQPNTDVLTGPRTVTATLPGAGMLTLNPSTLPGALIEQCRAAGTPSATDLTTEFTEDAAPDL